MEKINPWKYIPDYQDPENYWSTTETQEASALLTAGFEVVHCDHSNPRRVNFVFDRTDDLVNSSLDYWNKKLLVDARELFDNYKSLLARVKQ